MLFQNDHCHLDQRLSSLIKALHAALKQMPVNIEFFPGPSSSVTGSASLVKLSRKLASHWQLLVVIHDNQEVYRVTCTHCHPLVGTCFLIELQLLLPSAHLQQLYTFMHGYRPPRMYNTTVLLHLRMIKLVQWILYYNGLSR